MSDFNLQDMSGRVGLCTHTVPLRFQDTIMASEMSLCFIYIKVSAVSAGVTALNPGTIVWETSYDDGVTWSAIPGIIVDAIIGAGEFFARFTSDVIYTGPICRITILPPVNETITVTRARKSRASKLVVFRAPAASGGGGGGGVGETESISGNTQKTTAVNHTTVPLGISYMLGFDGTLHREFRIDAGGRLVTTNYPTDKTILATRIVYSVTPVTTAAYVQLTASTSDVASQIFIWESSGKTLALATGGAGSEVIIAYIPPGGLEFSHSIAAGTRLSIIAISGNATVGECLINIF